MHDHGTKHGTTGAGHVPQAHDPEHDIDARSATIWVIAGTVVLFLSLWVMVPIFMRVLGEERVRKIDQVQPTERLDVLEEQQRFLSGGNPKMKSIEQAMKDRAAGK